MSTDRDFPIERPTKEVGDIYCYSDEDFAKIASEVFAHTRELPEVTESDAEEIASEVFAHTRELPEVTESDAEEIARMVYDIGTGEWLTGETD